VAVTSEPTASNAGEARIFEFEAAKHQRFEVKRRAYYLARIDSELREKQRADDDSESENYQNDHD
jgi:hypothetical protein